MQRTGGGGVITEARASERASRPRQQAGAASKQTSGFRPAAAVGLSVTDQRRACTLHTADRPHWTAAASLCRQIGGSAEASLCRQIGGSAEASLCRLGASTQTHGAPTGYTAIGQQKAPKDSPVAPGQGRALCGIYST